MKKSLPVFVLILILCAAATAFAVDMASVDKVSILMPKQKVLSLIGNPHETVTPAKGLKVDVYPVDAALPLIHAGCIYDQDGLLMGQSFVFQGAIAGKIAERLNKLGFSPMQTKDGALRFAGVDDDNGRPLVAVVAEHDHLTTITTFEKNFYEAHVQ